MWRDNIQFTTMMINGTIWQNRHIAYGEPLDVRCGSVGCLADFVNVQYDRRECVYTIYAKYFVSHGL